MDRRHVYLLIRINDTTAKLVLALPMLNALKVESKIHELFRDSRFTITKHTPNGKWFQSHCKVGIATNVESRLASINKSKLDSGRTEWFAATSLEIVFICGWIWWECVKPYFILIGIIVIIFFSLYIAKYYY